MHKLSLLLIPILAMFSSAESHALQQDLDGSIIAIEQGETLQIIADENYKNKDLWTAIWYATNEQAMFNPNLEFIKVSNTVVYGSKVFVPRQEEAKALVQAYPIEPNIKTKGVYYWKPFKGNYHVLRFFEKEKLATNIMISADSPEQLADVSKWLTPTKALSLGSGSYSINGNYIQFIQSGNSSTMHLLKDYVYKGVVKGDKLYLNEFYEGVSIHREPPSHVKISPEDIYQPIVREYSFLLVPAKK